ncbi:TPA: hypothetical protein L9L57_005630 [Klebsiella pneumoniae]|nr:hypothetical protein [Klebsiella pneumoniae]HBR1478634.1 hypothetical protein [Klebsiella pneumoniae]
MSKEKYQPSELSSIFIWRILINYLFEKYYGIEINDTPFSEADVIKSYIKPGYSLLEAVNAVVQKYHLTKN